ncbi:hypothetical protein ALQ94_101811 [Pseudomonas amygdali pv. morsprunorum]|uniref:Uncharacterized protein n=1 Tax=Pseudomonas amygdali pv. morsprunorum TaxID=129138 RepID=A0A3M2WID9_PSEA0|nr:hypothetical protein ALQ94_101811 [Pseudomonas amygdali pv. morsprunorum]
MQRLLHRPALAVTDPGVARIASLCRAIDSLTRLLHSGFC